MIAVNEQYSILGRNVASLVNDIVKFTPNQYSKDEERMIKEKYRFPYLNEK